MMPRMRTVREKAVDLHIGLRIRNRRKHLGLSQIQLSQLVGIRYQQLQKYENATNRVCASRLVSIARALSTPIRYFLPDHAVKAAQPSDSNLLRKDLLPILDQLRDQIDNIEMKLGPEG